MMPRLTPEFREYVYLADLSPGTAEMHAEAEPHLPVIPPTRTVTARYLPERDVIEVQVDYGVVVLSPWLVKEMFACMNVYQAIDEAARLVAYRARGL